MARSSADKYLAWVIGSDVEPMVFVDAAANNAKNIRCLAELAHHSCQSTGITELTMIDHDLKPKLEAGHISPIQEISAQNSFHAIFNHVSSLNEWTARVRMAIQWLFATM